MDDPVATLPRSIGRPAWQSAVGNIAAIFLFIVFIVSGFWKMYDPFTWATVAEELRVPPNLSMALTLLLAVGESFAALMILIPRFRRWGAWLVGLLLVVFMIYIGVNYNFLVGKDCSCFPLVKRTVGPGFFEGDAALLLLAVLAGLWSRPAAGLRGAATILAALVVLTGTSYAVNAARQTGTKAPDALTVDGKPYSLQQGRIFLFFYDPECGHCDQAARHMAKLNWGDTVVIAIPTRQPQFAAAFLRDTGLKALTSYDLAPLKKLFPFVDPPFGVALERGREKGAVSHYDPPEPAPTLHRLGYAQ
ncbi:MAG: DoxX family protein [Bryobacteraceae bacterium]